MMGFRRLQIVGIALALPLLAPPSARAANARSFIEAVRAQAPIVYWGTVSDVDTHDRSALTIRARASIRIGGLVRGQGGIATATIEYSGFDDLTPALEGGPQYQLHVGEEVVVFTDGLLGSRPRFLMSGRHEDVVRQAQGLRDRLAAMPEAQLQGQEISAAIRKTQITLYDRLLGSLRQGVGPSLDGGVKN
jgi:hypothetical protein